MQRNNDIKILTDLKFLVSLNLHNIFLLMIIQYDSEIYWGSKDKCIMVSISLVSYLFHSFYFILSFELQIKSFLKW